MGVFFQFYIVKIGTLCFLPSPLCGEMGGRGLKHCKTQYFWYFDFRRGLPGAQEESLEQFRAKRRFVHETNLEKRLGNVKHLFLQEISLRVFLI